MSKEASLVDEMLRCSAPCNPELISSLEQRLREEPTSLETRLVLAMSLSKDPVTALRAIELYRDILAVDDFSTDALHGITVAYYSLGKYKKARKFAQRLHRQCPDSKQAQDLHSAVVYKQEEREKKEHSDAVQIGSGVAIGIGILAGAVLVAKALSSNKK